MMIWRGAGGARAMAGPYNASGGSAGGRELKLQQQQRPRPRHQVHEREHENRTVRGHTADVP